MKVNKLIQNITLVALMIISLPLIVNGVTYLFGIGLVFLVALSSIFTIFSRNRKNKKKNSVAIWTAVGAFLFVPLSFIFLDIFPIFGSGLDGLSRWASLSLVSGIIAIVLTSIDLFRS